LSSIHRRLTFFGVKVDLLSLDDLVAVAEQAMASRKPVRHTALNVAKLVNLTNNAELAFDVNSSDIVGVDGMGIAYGLRLFGQRGVRRVAGIDLFYALLAHCAKTGRKPFILGATQANLERAMDEARRRYPGLVFAGSRNGYFTADDRPQIVKQIASSGADCLFVAMPTPHKERFLNAHAAELGVPFMMGVGGSVDVLAGHISRAPLWMQNIGLEWLHRLLQEPRKMFLRYSRTNARFAVMLARSLLTGTNPVQSLAATASDTPR
jgi:N-acetylglucosaminyldiphosphoundecaprenol N-acetyl-beta-D-mannosaminyltransferase